MCPSSRPTRPGALEHPRPRARKRRGTCPRSSAPPTELETRIGFLLALFDEPSTGGHRHDRRDSSTSATWSTTSTKAIAFYTTHLGFEVLTDAAPAFADVKRGNLRLLLAGPKSSAGRPMPDGRTPGPGRWNRIHFIVDDIEAEVARLRDAGARSATTS